MARRRIINTRFWNDSYIAELIPNEKLLFLYFLTNPYTNICGAYELPMRQIVVDSGFSREEVDKMMKKFDLDKKIYYRDGYVIVKNFIKHQEVNPNVLVGIENEVSKLPYKIRKIVSHSLSNSLSKPSLSNLTITKIETKTKKENSGEGSNEPKTQWGKRGGMRGISEVLKGK